MAFTVYKQKLQIYFIIYQKSHNFDLYTHKLILSFVKNGNISNNELEVIFIRTVGKLLSNCNEKIKQLQIKPFDQTKKDSEKLIIEMNDKFHKNADIKKNSASTKISQMKETAIKEIKDTSIKLAVDSVKKIISTSVDKSKLDNLFKKNLEETKSHLKKINS